MENQQNKGKFPGYPHYPAEQDITRSGNNNGREASEDENTTQQSLYNATDVRNDNVNITSSGSDADVTAEDIRALESADQGMDTTDSNNLQFASLDDVDDDGDPLNEESSLNMDMTGEDLDVPGSSDDDTDEIIGEEDEENNYYSLGGDNHEDQEENKGE